MSRHSASRKREEGRVAVGVNCQCQDDARCTIPGTHTSTHFCDPCQLPVAKSKDARRQDQDTLRPLKFDAAKREDFLVTKESEEDCHSSSDESIIVWTFASRFRMNYQGRWIIISNGIDFRNKSMKEKANIHALFTIHGCCVTPSTVFDSFEYRTDPYLDVIFCGPTKHS